MTTATLVPAHDKKRRLATANLVERLRRFAIGMYEVHGGWFVHDTIHPAGDALARAVKARQRG